MRSNTCLLGSGIESTPASQFSSTGAVGGAASCSLIRGLLCVELVERS